jgi:GNAT superfamily N-acetyltransferase
VRLACFDCGAEISGHDVDDLGEQFLVHAREAHDWPYPDQAVRNYAAATQRLTGPSERLASIGEVAVHPVDDSRLDDWARFFDHDAFVGKPEWAACYCLEPHVRVPDEDIPDDAPHWEDNRTAMLARLRGGRSHGYLAYVDGRPAGWVNASWRADYTLYPDGDGDPPGDQVVGVSCFIIAPPYRRHGIAEALLDRVMADAADRGAAWVEAYPFNEQGDDDAGAFRGPRSMYDARGFEPIRTADRHTVVRRRP